MPTAMAGLGELALGGLLALVGIVSLYKLSRVARAALALWSRSLDAPGTVTDGEVVAVEGEAVVDEPAPAADRLFDGDETVGAYLWRAQFTEAGNVTYDSDRGEFRQGRNTFASGVEAGRVDVTTGGRKLAVDPSWLREVHDAPALADIEVGNPARNVSLPVYFTRYVWDSAYAHLRATPGKCSGEELAEVVDLYREDVHTDGFAIDARGVADGRPLFVSGEIRVEDGRPTVVGTDETPLLLSDAGSDGLRRALLWRAARYIATALAMVGIAAFFLS